MGTQKRKRSSARLAGKPRASKPPVVLLLPRFPDELEPRLPRTRNALRRPPSRAARPSALAARPPAAQRATSVGQRPARATAASRLPPTPPHVRQSRTNSVDAKIPAGAVSRTVGRSNPRRGEPPDPDRANGPRGSTVEKRRQPQSDLPDGTSVRPLSFKRAPLFRNWHALPRAAAGPGFSVSKRRPPKASTAVQSSNPCRSGRRSYILSRGSRSKAYTKSLSPSTSVGSARSGALNKLLNSIRESVHRLELLLLGGVL